MPSAMVEKGEEEDCRRVWGGEPVLLTTRSHFQRREDPDYRRRDAAGGGDSGRESVERFRISALPARVCGARSAGGSAGATQLQVDLPEAGPGNPRRSLSQRPDLQPSLSEEDLHISGSLRRQNSLEGGHSIQNKSLLTRLDSTQPKNDFLVQ